MSKSIILFLAANPLGTTELALGREARAIHEELERSGQRDRFEFVTRWAVQPVDLIRELRKLKPTVVHFSGHGGTRGRPQNGGPRRDVVLDPCGDAGADDGSHETGLFFQGLDGRAQFVTARALRETFGATGASVKLVVLNACYSSAQAESLLAHVDCVVGVRGSLIDDAARAFAVGFYGGLGERQSVAAAYLQGCAAVCMEEPQGSEKPQLRVRDGVDANQVVLAEANALGRERPIPVYPDAEVEQLSKRIEDARARRDKLRAAGLGVDHVDREILELRRQLREGGQLRPGDALRDGRYLLVKVVGRGGFAIVWEAYDCVEQQRVAIKVLHSSLAGDPQRLERFFRGARAMMELRHPAVVRVLTPPGEDGGFYYFAMDFIAGGNLREAVLAQRVTSAELLSLILQVGDALALAHAKGMVHRDVKPSNILIGEDGAAKLTDFDLVGAHDTTGGTRTGALGTVVYAAPECLERPQEATARADVFGLGMTAIFCLVGRDLSMDTFRSPERTICKLACSSKVRAMLRRAVAWAPNDRFADAAAMMRALHDAKDSTDMADPTDWDEPQFEFLDDTPAEGPHPELPGALDVVPALTIISHPLTQRVGERCLLDTLAHGGEVSLSRNAPHFVRPDRNLGWPLGDPRVSRKPIRFAQAPGGGVRVIVDPGGTPVIAGALVNGSAEFTADELTRGVALELAERVVLLLHQVDRRVDDTADPLDMVGSSAGIRRVRSAIERVVDLVVPVLLRGEAGTGKELAARAIHARSPRRSGPFVSVNLRAMPRDLAAAELFGSTRDAYTGARDRDGLFREAHGGTLFLDEVGDAPPEVQVRLLRVLETGEIYPVGAERPVTTNVRLIAATGGNLEEQIRRGQLEALLLHRLAGFEVQIPPLRERREDIGPLFYHFAREELEALGESHRLSPQDPYAPPWLPAKVAAQLVRYAWPGNIHQLRDITRQLVIESRGLSQIRIDPRLADQLGVPPSNPAVEIRRKPSDMTEDIESVKVIDTSQTWQIAPLSDDSEQDSPELTQSAHLRMLAGGCARRAYPLETRGVSIGREDCDVIIDDPQIARKHAQIERSLAGWLLQDLGSPDGFYVNGRGFGSGKRTPLPDGSVIRLGDSVMVFRAAPMPADPRGDSPVFPGVSPEAAHVRRRINELADSSGHVLIVGETGTGKGSVAKAIGTQRSPHPFVTLNCAQHNREMARSELFGHVRGAFTTALSIRPGLVDLAGDGALFLDEIDDLPVDLQAELLRFLEDGSYRALGATDLRKSPARVVAATRIDLDDAVLQARFRRDLLARLRAIHTPLTLPPLRERREDILGWTQLFFRQHGREPGDQPWTADALECLLLYPWQENLRQLLAAVNFAAGQTSEFPCTRAHLPAHVRAHRRGLRTPVDPRPDGPTLAPRRRVSEADRPPPPDPTRDEIIEVLRETRGETRSAAQLLKIHRYRLYQLCTTYDINLRDHRARPDPQNN